MSAVVTQTQAALRTISGVCPNAVCLLGFTGLALGLEDTLVLGSDPLRQPYSAFPSLCSSALFYDRHWEQHTCARGPSLAPAAASSSGVGFLAAATLKSAGSLFLALRSSRFSLVLFFFPAQ